MNETSIFLLKLVLFICWPWLVYSKGEQGRLLVNMTLVQNASALGAYCLDGSLPAYHLHRGFGAGTNNWLLQFEGGGWCNDIKSCLDRSKSAHGSTRYMNKWEVFSGILSNNASFNPDFYNWNRVKIRYCDGASFSGDAKFYNGTSLLYFRGQRIWQAIILDLLPKGLGHAKKALLSGCSAGGLATFLHCDNFTSYLPKNASVKCLSDAGFFLDERDISLNHTIRFFYENLISLQGVEPNLNKNCTSTLYYPHLCFFPQYALPYIETPFFILNSAYDVYQFHHILVPPSSDPRRHWDHCKLNLTACNASQLNILQGFRKDMLAALRDFYQNSRRDGMYINSCFTHCQSETQDTWFGVDSPRIHNKDQLSRNLIGGGERRDGLYYFRGLPHIQLITGPALGNFDLWHRRLGHPSNKALKLVLFIKSASVESSDGNGALRSFKLKESTFLAAQMPKKEIAADRFIEAHPQYDGRGVVIAIFDSGVDPAAAGLRVTSDGKQKVIDVIDCTGSGDVDTSTVVKADEDGCIVGASGASLVINSSWKNPSGEWHVGCKLVYELFTDTLTSRVKKERKKRWDEKNQEAIAEAVKQLDQFDKKHTKVEDVHLKMVREDLQNRVDLLRKQADSYDDKGPVIDAVVWHDGELWRAALDTQSLEDETGCGKLADFVPLTNYRLEQKHGVFSKLDACTCVLNIYNGGNILSIVTDSSPHATHVAGIAAAFHPEEPLLNGVAPGAQIVSCKIGDSRLGSMETGTGLTRALIAAVEHKCDLINMSYGEPTLLPDYGRFVDLVNEVVNKHRLIFISSAGNNGPALTTVGAPGGTSSSIIGVGAYVSPAMAAGAHLLVEPPTEGLEYTWSSRGPTMDGDLGVSISAPGGAVAPVPTWTLQRRMLMNGTSMASPSACGGVALILSAMKAEGISVSPYSVRKALENTSIPVGALPEEKLTAGQGLMQVDKAYEYMQKVQNLPCVWYQVNIKQSGITRKPTSSATSRGIYLREPLYCHQSTEWTVEIAPKFHEDANNLDQLVPFEECIELHSTGEAVVRAPDYLLLTHNGRSFSIVVDPTNLSDGLHYYEVYGVDSKAPWRGPLFRIPVTITKPSIVTSRPPLISFQGISFVPGQIERRFIEVPFGATWVEATMRTYGFDTARRFFIDTVQLSPLQRPIKWESVATFSSPSSKSFTFRVEGGQTMELAIAQFWSSGIGSHETTVVDFEIAFRGINISKEEVVLDGSEAPVRIDAEALLSTEKLVPSAALNKIRVPYRPIDCKLHALSADRDKLPSGKQILALTLIYKFKLEDDAELKPQLPVLNNRIYDNKFESQFYMISDVNKRVHAEGDVYPESAKLPKGEYTLQLYLRHDNVQYLEKMKQLVIFIERKLEEKDIVRLNFYSQPDGPLTGDGSFSSSDLVPGVKEAFYVGPPAKDKIPKNSHEGSVLFGPISYEGGKSPQKNPASYQISYIVPPIKLDEDKGKSSSDTRSVSERLEEEVRDAKIKVLASLNQGTDEERAEWKKLCQSLKSEYPKYTPLLAKVLEGVLSQSNIEDKFHHFTEIISVADEVIASIDRDELAKYFALRSDPEDEATEKVKKKMETTREQLTEALYQKGLALAELEALKDESTAGKVDVFEENFKELKKWVDLKSSKYGILSVLRERHHGRLGTAIKVLNDMIQDDGNPPKKKFYELKLSLLNQIGWSHLVVYEKQWMQVRFPSSLPLF